MIQINCMFTTPEIKEMAKKLGKSDVVTTNAVATWQSENNTPEMPTLAQLKEQFDKAEQEKKDYYLALPIATTTSYNPKGAMISHNKVTKRIIMMNLPEVNPLEHFFNAFNIPELKNLVLVPQEAYWFMLWREQQFIANDWEKTDENIKKANQEAINRLKEYKRQNPHANEKLSPEHHKAVQEIDDYLEWSKQHVTFDKDTHTYYVDGNKVDYSVSEYYRMIFKSKDLGDKYIESSSVGNTMDAIYRDFFDKKDVYSISYPNLNDSRKEQVINDLKRFRLYLDKEHGEGLYKVYADEKLRMVVKLDNGVTIAGTPDLLVIDKNGNRFFYDMKAKSHAIDQTFGGKISTDARDYTAQQNFYGAMSDILFSTGKTKALHLIWMDTNISDMRYLGFSFNTDKKSGQVFAKRGLREEFPIQDIADWKTPLLKEKVEDSIIPLPIKKEIAELTIPSMSLYSKEQKNKNNQKQMAQKFIPSFYEGFVTPEDNTVFVFGSNPKGIHGAGAAAVAKSQFGAIQGQGEGLQGHAYAIPTKDLDKARGTRWYKPGQKEETEVKDWYKTHSYSEVYLHPLNAERSITPQHIVASIKKMYQVAEAHPMQQFKVNDYPLGKLSLNGYLGEEMMQLFKDAGPIPPNVMFSKNWINSWSKNKLLAPNSSIQGENISSSGSEFVKKLTNSGNNNTSSSLNVSTPTIQITESSNPAVLRYSETSQYLPYDRPDISLSRVGFTTKETPMTKLAKNFSPTERALRVEAIARDFSRYIDIARETLIEETETELAQAKEANDTESIQRLNSTLELLKDEDKGRKETIDRYTVPRLANDVRQKYYRIASKTVDQADATYGKGMGAHVIEAAKKILDNFYPLLDEATLYIEHYEDLRIVLEDGKDSTSDRGGYVEKTQKEMDAEEQNYGDDEEGARVNGSEGWSYKVRFIDPHSTVTSRVKKILSNILYYGENGFEKDDMGNSRYLPERVVYTTLLNELLTLVDSDDFAIKDDEGNYTFPALEKLKSKHPWVSQIINKLEGDPILISQFYAAFRKEFIPYYMQFFEKQDRKTNAMNKTLAEDGMMDSIYAAYNKGISFSKNSIYNVATNIIPENVTKAKKLIEDIYTILNNFNQNQITILTKNVTEVSRMLGINIQKQAVKGIINSEEGESTIRDWATAASDIINKLDREGLPKESHLIDRFKGEYSSIARALNNISDTANIMHFSQKDSSGKRKSYYSVSAPNFLYGMIKKFKKGNYKEYIDVEYKQFPWFYTNDRKLSRNGWMSGWVHELLTSKETRNQLAIREHVFYRDKRQQLKEYNQWTPEDVENIFFTEYWSISNNRSTTKQYALFNVPICSDSEQALFIKFSKFSGPDYKEEIIDALSKVVMQELSRIKLVRKRIAEGKPEIMYFDKNGLKFQFFPRFNTNGFLNEVMPYVDADNIAGLKNRIKEVLREEMDTQFKEYLAASKLDLKEARRYLIQEGKMQSTENVLDFVEEYYWNNAYAQTQILELTIIDPAFYKNGNDLQKRFKEIIASGTKLFTNSKFGRKIERTIYLKDFISVSSSYTSIKDNLDRAVAEGRIATYDRDNILYLFGEVNATDAQAYRTTSSYRAVIDMLQGWTPKMEQALKNFEAGVWDMEDFNTVWQTIKPFVFTHIPKDDGFGGKLKVGHQNKNSEFLLLAMYGLISQSMGNSGIIRGLNRFMEDRQIDVAQFISAVKTGGETTVDITYSPDALNAIKQDSNGIITARWTALKEAATKDLSKKDAKALSDIDIYRKGYETLLAEGTITQEEYNKAIEEVEPTEEQVIKRLEELTLNNDGSFKEHIVHKIPYEDYVVQQPTPEHIFDILRSVFGSQFRNLLTSDLSSDFTMTIAGKTLNKDQVLRLYQGCIVENLLEDYNRLSGEFSNIESLQKMLISQVKGNSKYGEDILNALEIIEVQDPNDETKTIKVFNVPLNSPNITDVIQELLLSSFKNNITKQYINGGACIAVSNFGFTNELQIHYHKEGDKASGIAYMDCYLPWYSKKYFAPFISTVTKTIDVKVNDKWTKKTVTYEELDYKKLEKEAPDLLKVIGFRIPTENKYSMFPLRIKGFLPQQNGSSIMLPMEATTLSGMDFDVDKVFLMIPEFREVTNYNMKAAWNDFYNDNPDISIEIDSAKWNAFVNEYSAIHKLDTNKIDFDSFSKEFKNWLKNSDKKNYEYLEGVKEKFNAWFKTRKNKYAIDKHIRKVNYSLDDNNPAELTAQNLNRAQRNNLLIDIAYGILTNKDTVDKILNPGNFNTLKLMSRVAAITGDSQLMEDFMKAFKCKDRKAAKNKLLKFIKTKRFKELDKFVDDYKKERNPLSPLTFVYYHQQNMVGAALIGMYANNTTAQAKFQQAEGFGISADYRFSINGRWIKSLSAVTVDIDGVQELVSKMCSEWSAASVDNVKDPVLAMLLQNTRTANVAGMLIRAGLTIPEVAMLFRQPAIVECITNTGNLNIKSLETTINSIEAKIASYNSKHKTDIPIITEEEALLEIKNNGLTSDDLLTAMVNSDMFNEADLGSSEITDFLREQLKILYLFKDLIGPIAQDVSELTKISRADSPNAAIATSISGAKVQVARAKRFLSRRTGDDRFALTGLDRVMDANVNIGMSIDELRTQMFKTKMPMLQAFFSLGIELPIQLIKEEYLPQMGKNVSDTVDDILYEASNYWAFGTNDNLKQVYRDMTTFALTGTKLFGNDDTNTFWDKYTYYTYEYPKHFLEAVHSNSDVAALPAISKMEVNNGEIVLNRAARIDKTVREIYMRSLDSLLYMEGDITMTIDGKTQTFPVQKLAVDLFMYAFYNNGLSFGANNYSAFLSSQYITAFPEFAETLRSIDKFMKSPKNKENFKEQFWSNRGSKVAVILEDTSPKHTDITVLENGSLSIKPEKAENKTRNNGEPYEYINYEGTLYRLESKALNAHKYSPVPRTSMLIYNANQELAELVASKVDPNVVDNNLSVGKTSGEYDMQHMMDVMTQNDDYNAVFEDPSYFSKGLDAAEGIFNEDYGSDDALDYIRQFEGSYESDISNRVSPNTDNKDKYNTDESNSQLETKMCKK